MNNGNYDEYGKLLLNHEPHSNAELMNALVKENKKVLESGDASNDIMMEQLQGLWTAYKYLLPKRFWRDA